MEEEYYSNGRGQNGNNSNFSWDFREVGTSRFDWSNGNPFNEDTRTTTTRTAAHGMMFSHLGETTHPHHDQNNNNNNNNYYYEHQSLMYSGASQVHPDPHLTCLKLGKRHYFEDGSNGGHVAGFPIEKKGRSGGVEVGSTVVTPRCQAEGCHVALVNAKDYHRRHKVCEMHSKAPKVVVLGLEQRFCQQCSRFHVVSEFDDSKRSCRRRLAGHNERRRKGSNESISRNLSQENRSMEGRLPCSMGSALSLLSSKTNSWVSSPSDLSSRSSAALRELIAENRAAILARQLFYDQVLQHNAMDDLGATQYQMFSEPSDWYRFHEANAQVTLDLMQTPSSLQVPFREDQVQERGRSVL